jgi:hypothetical protein
MCHFLFSVHEYSTFISCYMKITVGWEGTPEDGGSRLHRNIGNILSDNAASPRASWSNGNAVPESGSLDLGGKWFFSVPQNSGTLSRLVLSNSSFISLDTILRHIVHLLKVPPNGPEDRQKPSYCNRPECPGIQKRGDSVLAVLIVSHLGKSLLGMPQALVFFLRTFVKF